MNIHLPAILGFTRYQGFDPSPDGGKFRCKMMIHRLSLMIDYYVVVVFVKY